MSDNTNNAQALRTTTITLDEYNNLKNVGSEDKELISALRQENLALTLRLQDKEKSEPVVKVIHFDKRKNPWNGEFYEDQVRTEYYNLTDVKETIKKDVKKDFEKELEDNKKLIKELRDNTNVLQDTIDEKDRKISRSKVKQAEEIADLKDVQTRREKDLNKAYDKDVKEYKETIKDLKEEIQKVKDSKTDAEIEEKRNKEIKSLKARISDLETFIDKFNASSVWNRLFGLRRILKDYQKEYENQLKHEQAANAVGTTWVREGEKVRKYDSFKSMYGNAIEAIMEGYRWTLTNICW